MTTIYRDYVSKLQCTLVHVCGFEAAKRYEPTPRVDCVIRSKPHPEQGYRSALGILRLGDKYGKERLERASCKALRISSPSYRTVKTMLKQQMESVPLPDEPAAFADTPEHLGAANVRGRGYCH